jgi:hypothetical protein
MNNTVQRIEEIEIQQILALDSKVSLAEARELHKKKMDLLNEYKNEQLMNKVESLWPRFSRLKRLQRTVRRLTNRSDPASNL